MFKNIDLYNLNNNLIIKIKGCGKMIKKLLEEMNINIDIHDSNYFYNGVVVQRTTHILSSMIHEEYLMQWANVLGLYKRKKYEEIKINMAVPGQFSA